MAPSRHHLQYPKESITTFKINNFIINILDPVK